MFTLLLRGVDVFTDKKQILFARHYRPKLAERRIVFVAVFSEFSATPPGKTDHVALTELPANAIVALVPWRVPRNTTVTVTQSCQHETKKKNFGVHTILES